MSYKQTPAAMGQFLGVTLLSLARVSSVRHFRYVFTGIYTQRVSVIRTILVAVRGLRALAPTMQCLQHS